MTYFRNIFNTAKEKQRQNPGILFLPSLSSPSLLYPALDFPLEKECGGPGLEKHPCAQQRTLWDHPETAAGTRPPFPASQPRWMAGTPWGLVHPQTRAPGVWTLLPGEDSQSQLGAKALGTSGSASEEGAGSASQLRPPKPFQEGLIRARYSLLLLLNWGPYTAKKQGRASSRASLAGRWRNPQPQPSLKHQS